LKKYRYSVITKFIVFILAIICFTGMLKAIVEVVVENNGDFNSVVEDDYFKSSAFIGESEALISSLTRLLGELKNEEHILNGGTINEDELRNIEEEEFYFYQANSKSYNPELSEANNYEIFKQEHAEQLSQAKENLIKGDLREYHLLLQNIEQYKFPLFYATDGENVFTNTKNIKLTQFKSNPSYMVFEDYKRDVYPKEIEQNETFHLIREQIDFLDPENTVVYVAFPEDFLQQKMKEWEENKDIATKGLIQFVVFLFGFILSLIYLVLTIGKKAFKDDELHFHFVDRLYNDINIILCFLLGLLWVALIEVLFAYIDQWLIIMTVPIASIFLVLLLSLIKHMKNKTFFKHTLIYRLIFHLVQFVGNVYKSGSVGVKTVLIVIGYPILIAVTFFIFPITIGIAAWFAYKKVKSFHAIQEGVEIIKDGNLQHRIEVEGKGEFSKLAANINSITDGLKNAVNSELKSERLKTELITNVSHDIRTPLTSIITYVDLLKHEKDPSKTEEYIKVLDQKSKRLKILTDDLFEAAKASSGNIPVDLDKIDIVSLITQGLGEVNDKVEAMELEFKLNHPKEKVYMTADGKLLWRSIENLLSNIFKYALARSRVYIDIEDAGNEIRLTFKNISANELNISADELMERFKRGDESRTSEGSGLGLSIAKNLIELQKGKFSLQIDGDLFKAIIYLPKYTSEDE
jgi:signal transduction histidine kinase